jgi:hypothetical protein
MRTKTLLLSALLGAVGSVAVQAQTNVYSLNAVGYIQQILEPGYNLITCPLLASPDNTINTLFSDTNGVYNGDSIYLWTFQGTSYSVITKAVLGTWNNGGGTNTLMPGAACFFLNAHGTNITNYFVGTVPTGGTNVLVPGYNLVGSMVPTSGDLYSNSISALSNVPPNKGDLVYVFDAASQGYSAVYKATPAAPNGNSPWSAATGDPSIPGPGAGFFYLNNTTTSTPLNWVENYSVSQ